jgi:hypothetical protein
MTATKEIHYLAMETLGFTLIVQEMLLQLAGTVVMLIFART